MDTRVSRAGGRLVWKVDKYLYTFFSADAKPIEFKPMSTVGKGVYEIRIHLEGAWRVLYVAKFEEAVYVLHVFKKKTRQTTKDDLKLAALRYGMIGE